MEVTNLCRPKVLGPDDGARLSVLGDEARVLLNSEETLGALTLVQQRSRPGSGIPLHINTFEDEVFQVLEGQVEFQVGKEILMAGPGTTVFLPRHVPHAFKVTGSEPALLQITITPGGLEKMIEEITLLPEPPSPETITTICRKHGVHFVGQKPSPH